MVVANWPIRARDLLLLCYNGHWWAREHVACVASVSNRVILRSPPPPPPPSFIFFAPVLSQLSRRTSRGNACYAGYWTWLLLHVLTLLVPFVRVLWLIILWKKNDFFRVFVNVFYIRRSCRCLVDCAVLDCPHSLYDMQVCVFVAFWSTFKSVFKNGPRISVDGLAKTHRNERFFQRSAVAWTGPLNPLTTDCFGRFRSILNDAYFPA